MSARNRSAPERDLLTVRSSSSTAARRRPPSPAAVASSPLPLLKRRHDGDEKEEHSHDSTTRSDGEQQREEGDGGSNDEAEAQWPQRSRGGDDEDEDLPLSDLFRSDGGNTGNEDKEVDEQQQQATTEPRSARVLQKLILKPRVQQRPDAVSSSSSGSQAVLAPASSSAADWTSCLTGSPTRHVVDSGLFLLQSSFLTCLCYDAADGRYRHAPYPAPAGPGAASAASASILFPSVLLVAVVQERGEQWLYAKDTLQQQRLQVHAGKLIAWKDGERRKVATAAQQSRAQKAREKQQQQLRQQRRSRAGLAAFAQSDEDDASSCDDGRAASSSVSSADELLDGRLLQCANTRQARVLLLHAGSRAQSASQPSEARFLSPKRDGSVTVCVRKPRKQEEWRLLPLSALRFSSLAHAASLFAGLKAKAKKTQREQKLRQRGERWQLLFSRDVRLGDEDIAEWKRRREEESQADWERCQDAQVRQRIMTIVLPASAQAEAQSSWTAFQRFSSAGMTARMYAMPTDRQPAAGVTVRLNEDDSSSSRATPQDAEHSEEDEEEAAGFSDWEPATAARSEHAVEQRWRREQLQKQMTAGRKRDRKRIRKPARDPSPPPVAQLTARRQQMQDEEAATARQKARESRQRQREQERARADEKNAQLEQEKQRRRQREAEAEAAERDAEAQLDAAQAVHGRRRLRKLHSESDDAGMTEMQRPQEGQQEHAVNGSEQTKAAPQPAERAAAAARVAASSVSSAEAAAAAAAAAVATAASRVPSICRPEWALLYSASDDFTVWLRQQDERDGGQRSS